MSSGRAVRGVPGALLRAATIRERLPVASAGPPSPEAAARLTQWRTQPPFADDGQWQARLAADGLLEADLLTLLGQPDVAMGRKVSARAWMRLLKQTMLAEADFPTVSDCRKSGISRTEAADSPGPGHSFEGMGLARFCAPLMIEAKARLLAGLDALAARTGAGVFDPGQLTEQLSESLPGVLSRCCCARRYLSCIGPAAQANWQAIPRSSGSAHSLILWAARGADDHCSRLTRCLAGSSRSRPSAG